MAGKPFMKRYSQGLAERLDRQFVEYDGGILEYDHAENLVQFHDGLSVLDMLSHAARYWNDEARYRIEIC